MTKSLNGTFTALITPFKKDERIDWNALEWLIEFQIENGINGLVPCGTTGESCTLSMPEHINIIRFVIEKRNAINPQIPVIAGTGSNNTAEAVQLTKAAKKVGADGVLAVSPYYNKPTPNGLLDYYRKIAAVGLPVILYDIPGRTARGVPTDTILKLAEEKSIVGIKWASGDMNQLMEIWGNTGAFSIFSGDDNLTYPLLTLGGNGVISVLANLLPKEITQLVNFPYKKTDHYILLPLMKAMFLETNPIPIKTALSLIYPKIFKPIFRSPMCQMERKNFLKLKKILQEYALM